MKQMGRKTCLFTHNVRFDKLYLFLVICQSQFQGVRYSDINLPVSLVLLIFSLECYYNSVL